MGSCIMKQSEFNQRPINLQQQHQPTCGIRAKTIQQDRKQNQGQGGNKSNAGTEAEGDYDLPWDVLSNRPKKPILAVNEAEEPEYAVPWDLDKSAGFVNVVRNRFSESFPESAPNGRSRPNSEINPDPTPNGRSRPNSEIFPPPKNLSTAHEPLMLTAFCGGGSLDTPVQELQREQLIQMLCSSKNYVPPQIRPSGPIREIRGTLKNKEKKSNDSEIWIRNVVPPKSSQVETVITVHGPSRDVRIAGQSDNAAMESSNDFDWEFCNEEKIKRLLQRRKDKNDQNFVTDMHGFQKTVASNDATGQNLKSNRSKLSLNFGCGALNPQAVKINPMNPLKLQNFYHGLISRIDAENKLMNCTEGSYLVRLSDSNKEEYVLSLKSFTGFFHIKIQPSDKAGAHWVLGHYSQPFPSISSMIRYYSINKLPIKGAEHMCLLNPVSDTTIL